MIFGSQISVVEVGHQCAGNVDVSFDANVFFNRFKLAIRQFAAQCSPGKMEDVEVGII